MNLRFNGIYNHGAAERFAVHFASVFVKGFDIIIHHGRQFVARRIKMRNFFHDPFVIIGGGRDFFIRIIKFADAMQCGELNRLFAFIRFNGAG